MIACRLCGQIHATVPLTPGQSAACSRCGERLGPRKGSLALTAAFSSAALLLYGPANVFPILRMNMYGAYSESTVWEGCVKLYKGGDVVIAAIVFLASIAVPLLKLLGLFFLTISCLSRSPRWRRARVRIYRFLDSIGRWAMLDVFMLAMVVALVRLRGMASVEPGKGALAFAAVVILTLLASQSFDPSLIWNGEEDD